MHPNITDLERRLRRALHADAQQVRPERIRSYATDSPARDVHSGQFRWSRLAGPAAVACAVLAVIAGTTLAGRSPANQHRPTVAKSAGTSPTRPSATTAGLPSFVVANRASSLKVFNTSTGATTGTLDAPAGLKFDGVASGGTSQTFLAYADPATDNAPCHAYYYRFQLAASGKPSALTLIRSIPGSLASAIAASPGGGTTTYSAVHCYTAPPNGLIGISGQAGNRTWAYDEADDYTFSLAATPGAGTLALSLFTAGSGWADLLLNTHSSAATVDGASRVLPAVPYADSLAISPDGATVYACTSSSGPAATQTPARATWPTGERRPAWRPPRVRPATSAQATAELAAYSIATGKLIRVLYTWTLSADLQFCQVSADATGKFLLATLFSDLTTRSSLIGINPQAGTAVKLPVQAEYVMDGVQAAW